jgi:hypothetical protein
MESMSSGQWSDDRVFPAKKTKSPNEAFVKKEEGGEGS